jgi:thioesterase domain-containing protein
MSSVALPKTTEQLVAEAWRRALGPKARSGGERILATSIGLQRLLRFLADIDKMFGVKIPPAIAIQLDSIQAIANAIDTGLWPAPSSLVMLRDGDTRDVLFIVSAGSGVILELCDLAQLISFPGRIYGLQMPGLAGETDALTSIPEMAEHFKTVILATAPEAKINVIGYSFGGIVTFELARALKRDGHALGLVGILDSTCYEKFWPKIEWIKAAAKRAKRKLDEAKAGYSLSGSLAFAAHCMHIAKLYIKRRLRSADSVTVAEDSAYYIGGLDTHFQNVRNACIAAFESYNPPFYDGNIVLFKSEFGDPNACNPISIWKPRAAEMKLIHVPGTHGNMIRKPFAETLAKHISSCLGG